MEEKRKDLIRFKQKKILEQIVASLNEMHPSFYYLSTVEVADEVRGYIDAGKLSREKYKLMNDLSREDIQILLSFHS